MEGKSFKCKCQLGYGGERCERRYKPCDDRPCSGHGDCIEVNKTSYRCLCLAWWEGAVFSFLKKELVNEFLNLFCWLLLSLVLFTN